MIFPSEYGSIHDIGLDVRWDSAAFARQVNRRAALLSKTGVGRGSIVGILHNGTAHFFADLFAVWKVGATAACLDSLLTDAELEVITDFARPTLLLAGRGTRAIKLSTPIVELETARTVDLNFTPDLHPDDPALVLFTSGTTGNPKGVVLSFRALLARISTNIGVIGKATLARTLVALPTHFGHGLIGNSLTAFVSGGEIVLHPLGASLASNLSQIIDQHAITFMSSVPALWHLAKSHSSRALARSSLMRVHVGSAPLSAQLWSEIVVWSGAEVVNCYGLTETANWVAGASSKVDGIAEGLIGRCWGSTIAVADDDGNVQPTGRGEIVVKTPSLMTGYLNRPDQTAAAVRDGWYYTGDRGSVDAAGRIYLTGRIKDEINRGGMKIQPAEIDVLLTRHPAIAEACSFGIPDPVSGQAVAALVRLVKGATVTPESLHAWCRERLRQTAIPERWIVVDEIPKNARGKVNRATVGRMFAEDSSVARPKNEITSGGKVSGSTVQGRNKTVALSTAAQRDAPWEKPTVVRRAVERAWIEILGASTFSGDIPWEKAGGDSLNLLRLWLKIEQALGKSLPIEAVQQDIKPSEIIERIEAILQVSSRQSRTKAATDRTPAVFFMPPADGDLPRHAHFRESLKDKMNFIVIRYPGWREMFDRKGSFDAVVSSAVSQILAHKDCDPCFLVGYSFGGFVAWETACRLSQLGRQVAFVGLIDTRRAWDRPVIERPEAKYAQGLLASLIRFLKSMLSRPKETFSIRGLMPPLVKRKAFWLLLPIARFLSYLNSKTSFEFQFRLSCELIKNALHSWEVSAGPLPVTLFRSREFYSESRDYGWAQKAAQVNVISMDESHWTLLQSAEFRERLHEAIRQASFGYRFQNTSKATSRQQALSVSAPRTD
jgi:acyl-CoA synthetase (AMP-forming)/AMP-acid ligase II/pimeloyl-ACP methyl ester carboxylesterase